jgi:uncharacterized membrane protein
VTDVVSPTRWVPTAEGIEVFEVEDSPRRLRPAGYVLIALAGVAWTAVVSGLAIWRHEQFLSHRFDLGNMVQAVWSTSQGRPLEMTDGASGEQIVRLAAHVDPILMLFTPLWWIHPGPEALIVAYVAVIASGVYPVVRLALKYTDSALASTCLAAWYLVFPWIIWIALNELNPLSLALPFLLFAIWFLDEERLGSFAAAAVLALATGEVVGLTIAALGVWYVVRHRRGIAGFAIAIAGVAWTAICLGIVVPAFNDGGGSRYYDRFESVGGSPRGLIETVFTDPGAIVAQVTTSGDFEYLLLLAIPTAFIFVGQPLLLIAAIPQLGLNLVSDFPSTVSPLYHYTAPTLAALIATCIVALGRLPRTARAFAAGIALVASILVLASVPPVPGTEAYMFADLESSQRRAAMRDAVRLVPPAAPVTVTNRLGAHLSIRRIVHLFPARDRAEWAVLDVRDPSNDAAWIGPTRFERHLSRLARDQSWRLVFDREDVRVYRRQP